MHERYCDWPGCERLTMDASHPMCAMHHKRQSRGAPMNAPVRESLDPWERCVVAAIDLADADSDDDEGYARAESRLRNALRMFAAKPSKHGCKHGVQSLGGKARAAALSPETRAEIARRAAVARWAKRRRKRRTGRS